MRCYIKDDLSEPQVVQCSILFYGIAIGAAYFIGTVNLKK
jgi:hypothetical protein